MAMIRFGVCVVIGFCLVLNVSARYRVKQIPWVPKIKIKAISKGNRFGDLKVGNGRNYFSTTKGSVSDVFKDNMREKLPEMLLENAYTIITGEKLNDNLNYLQKLSKIKDDIRVSQAKWKDAIDSIQISLPVRVWTNKKSICASSQINFGSSISLTELDNLLGPNDVAYFTNSCSKQSSLSCSLLLAMDIPHEGNVYTLRGDFRKTIGSTTCNVDRIEDFPYQRYVKIFPNCSQEVYKWSNPANTFRAKDCGNYRLHVNQHNRNCEPTPVSQLCALNSKNEGQIAAAIEGVLKQFTGMNNDICVVEAQTSGSSNCGNSDPEVKAAISNVRSANVESSTTVPPTSSSRRSTYLIGTLTLSLIASFAL